MIKTLRSIRASAIALLVALLAMTTLVTGGSTAQAVINPPVGNVMWPLPNTPRLDQGVRGTCGFFAAMQQYNMVGSPDISQATANIISDRAQAMPVGGGATSDSNLKLAMSWSGFAANYVNYGNNPDAALNALRSGPVTISIKFYSGMYTTNSSYQWMQSGTYLSMNHAVVLRGVDYSTNRVYLLNQWGTGWGNGGTMWMSMSHFRAAISNGGFVDVWSRA